MTVSVTHTKTLVAPDSGVEDKIYGVDYVSTGSHAVTGLATVAESGAYGDLSGLPTLGTAASTAAADYATAAQGTKADAAAPAATLSSAAYTLATDYATHSASSITASTFALARLGAGTPNVSTFLAGDGNWLVPVYGNISSLPVLGTAASTAAADYALSTHFHGAAAVTSSTFALARIAGGTYNASTYLSGTSTFNQPSFSSLANMPVLGTAAATAATDYATHSADSITASTFALARIAAGTYNASTYLSGTSTFNQPSFSSLANMPVLGTVASTAVGDYAIAAHFHAANVVTTSTFALARLGGGATNISTFLNGTSSFTQPVYANLSGLPTILTTSSVRVTSIKNSTTTSSLPIPELLFNVSNTVNYAFTFALVYATVSSTTGVKVGLSTGTVSSFSARAVIPVAAAGTDADMSGYIVASGGTVIAPSTPVASTKYCAMVTGTILPSADGVLQLTYGTEVAGSAVSTFVGSYGTLTTIP